MLKENGIKAAALTGAQAGFLTNAQHTDAKIIEMKTERLFVALASHDAVVVAGFQERLKRRHDDDRQRRKRYFSDGARRGGRC